MNKKMAQYRDGQKFVQHIVDAAGHGTLQRRVGAARELADRAGDSQPGRLDQARVGRGVRGDRHG